MLARFAVEPGVLAPFVAVPEGASKSEESGVVGSEVLVLKDGRSSDFKDGDGGSGSGGLL
jgi:hypothetical protein